MKKKIFTGFSVFVALLIMALIVKFVFLKNLYGRIAIPYISHQKPLVDPLLPGAVPLADKLDEVLFDGLFNISANASGVTYEDGLGELIGMDDNNVVSVRLKVGRAWHSSYSVALKKRKADVSLKEPAPFSAQDLRFTLRRIQALGSRSPDYILVHQAVEGFDFSGPDDNGEVRFRFKDGRVWSDNDIKEVLSFKIMPYNSNINQLEYTNGTGPYMKTGEFEETILFQKNPGLAANIPLLYLEPFIDNSTFTTELRNKNINVLLSTPFGAVSPILADTVKFFAKSSVATTFFALLHNVKRLNIEQRRALRNLVDNRKIMYRLYRIGTAQQRNIANYKGNKNNYEEYLNYSVFPSTTYYVEEEIVMPRREREEPNLAILPDTIVVKTCASYELGEELSELAAILNDPTLFSGRIKASIVKNDEIMKGDYDAVIVPITGYRSNFLFDLYSIFLREPDFSACRINFKTLKNADGTVSPDPLSFTKDKNFFRMDLQEPMNESELLNKLLSTMYEFMSTSEIGDKQVYAQMVDDLDKDAAFATWLFSIPALAYFSTQFDEGSVELYGSASQLSTIEKWSEKK